MLAVARHSLSGNARSFLRFGWLPVCLSLALTAGVPRADDSSPSVNRPGSTGTDAREWRVTRRVAKGDTLPQLLESLGLSPASRTRWLRAVAKQAGVAEILREGDDVHFDFTEPPWTSPGRTGLTSLRIERLDSKPRIWQAHRGRIVYHRAAGTHRTVAAAPAPAAIPAPVAIPAPAATPAAADPAKSVAAAPAKPVPKAPSKAASPVTRVTHVLRKGENLGGVLRNKGVAGKAAQPWIEGVRKRYPLKRLYPGRKIVLYFVSRGGSRRSLQALQIESRRGNLLTWQRTDDRIVYRGRNRRVVENQLVGAPPPAPAKPPSGSGPPALASRPLPPTRSFEPLEKVIRTVGRGQTLGRIFRPLGITGKEAEAWFGAIDKQYPVTRLRPGQRLHLYFDRTPARHRKDNLKAVEIEVRKGRKLTWERVGKKIRFGSGSVLGRRRTEGAATGIVASNGVPSAARKGSFLSEYALARIKQRNGLLEYTPPPNGTLNGARPVPPLDDAERVRHKLKSGEHLWGVLRKYELDDKERRRWLTALQKQRYVRRLRAGSRINFYFKAHGTGNGATAVNGNGAAAGNLLALEIVLRSDLRLTWYRNKEKILFYKDQVPYQQEVRSVSGVITEGSLYGSAKRAGVAIAVISHMVDILGWDINFQQDLRAGDTYRVLYRRKYRPGSKSSDQIRILAAEFVNRGRTHKAVYFQGADGHGHYYNPDGRSVSRSFLRYPVEYRRISSRFSHSRFHPILRVRRPHYGVDFAARTGTPIRTVADGRVTYARWKGAYGRLVEVSHGGGMKTRYAHLRRYGPGIRRGVNVKKGQTIGYVGCSGLCTGPHLHFEMWQDNRYVDPLKANVPVERQLDPLLMGIFEDTKELFFERLEADRKTAGLPSPTPS